jgi:hypothetical protein
VKPMNEKYARDDDTDSVDPISQPCSQDSVDLISHSQPRKIVPKFHQSDIILESKRGKSIGEGYCDRCGRRTNSLTRYRQSTVGVVDLCNGCKAEVRDRSFGYIDVFSRGRVIGGFRW